MKGKLKEFIDEYIFSKYLWSNYSYILLITIAFLMLMIIGHFWSLISTAENFWISVLPSAFVDVISIVISTIIVAIFIDNYQSNKEKNNLYKILKVPHQDLINGLLSPYFVILRQLSSDDKATFKIYNINDFIEEHISNEILDKKIIKYKSYWNKASLQDLIDSGEVNVEEVLNGKDYASVRAELYGYKKESLSLIEKYLSEYKLILSKEYMILLFEIKSALNQPAFNIIKYNEKYFQGGVQDKQDYGMMHQKFADSILKLIRYFNDIDVQKHWNDEVYEKDILNETREHRSIFALFIFIGILIILMVVAIKTLDYFIL
ncbi:hypothetical protein [Lysinibacillus sphaericus]|uniref:hypothetical protein n=1 Tax=Lysinibacillus sphaericus TaxID=1421 RepID=UPI0004DEEE72|nr:hypothetical protein [Lysinibacillus sphaericus]QPA53774.1 hypothetical protein INQ53_18620 [Lysinibacillus sphaericus]QPA58098.1 hypothetical protein INQ55_18670 [Lysinibacillus sphaericus]